MIRNNYQTQTLSNLLSRLERLHQVNKMRLFYRKIKKKPQAATNPTFVIWNPDSCPKNPTFSNCKDEYIGFWTRYLEKVFAQHSPLNINLVDKYPPSLSHPYSDNVASSVLDKLIPLSEVQKAIDSLKNWKAAGLDEITNEDIKLVGAIEPDIILKVLQKIWKDELCPEQFR